MVLKNKTYEHDANEETWQLCFFLRRSCEKNPVDWTRKVAKFRPPHAFQIALMGKTNRSQNGDFHLKNYLNLCNAVFHDELSENLKSSLYVLGPGESLLTGFLLQLLYL